MEAQITCRSACSSDTMTPSSAGGSVTVWHTQGIDDSLAALKTSGAGLSSSDVSQRLERHGRNDITDATRIRPWAIFVRQFASLMVGLLAAAAIIAAVLGEWVDAAAVLVILTLNAVVGFFQEYRAERAMAALRSLAAPHARVRRDGAIVDVTAAEIVPGDILVVEAGDLVAADARVLRSSSLTVGESALTGESLPVEKRVDIIPSDAALGDRANMIFLGTAVTSGSGEAVVVATGMATELGRIAGLIQSTGSGEAPLQLRLAALGRLLVWISLGIIAVLFGLGVLRGNPLSNMFMTSISLAVAAVPEGLPAIVTVALALGVQRMAKRRALVRRLPAVETLGSTSVICTDKTGTLTMNAMTVRTVAISGCRYVVAGEGYQPVGAITVEGSGLANKEVLDALLLIAGGCSNATVREHDGQWTVIGDPTEAALTTLAIKGGWSQERIALESPREAELPFDGERKRMTMIRRHADALRALVKGAPDLLVEQCTEILTSTGPRTLSAEDRATIAAENTRMAEAGLRVLGVAMRELPAGMTLTDSDTIERELIWVGLIGMQDPPRPQAHDAVARCRSAGIRVVMITGDHPQTALAIARQIGIADSDSRALSGKELEGMDEQTLAKAVPTIAVFARTTAAHKLRIVQAWKSHGAVVAMTGDGVNDAPALKGADIGIAMGGSGTEVTKEASSIVILDDDFSTIVAAVEEGRGIYANIRKTVEYLLAGNAGELLLMGTCIVVGLPIPLLPVHLLWINLVTDGLPALCLAVDPPERDLMSQPPRDAAQTLTDRATLLRIAVTGLLTASMPFLVFLYALHYEDLDMARTHAFATLVFCELFRAFGARSRTLQIWQIGLLSNFKLFLVVVASVALQIASHHIDWLGRILRTSHMSLNDCFLLLALGLAPMAVLEIWKWLAERRRRKSAKS